MDALCGTCDKCGWRGNDWSFKYQGLCSKCYKQWRKEKAEERRKLKPPNDNVEVADGLLVTRNVLDRLRKQSESDIPHTRFWHLMERCEGFSLFLSLISMLLLIFSYNFLPEFALFLVTCAVFGFVIAFLCKRISKAETEKRKPIVNDRLEELVRERQKRIEDANAFYSSAEWRLLRQKIIDQHGHDCQECGCHITDDFDLTVDHVNPRSIYPDQSLDLSNLRVLCRSCNTRKGNRNP
jgi:hypothetical protein